MNTTTINTMTLHYLVCALWSSKDDDGEPLDGLYSIDDIADETKNQAAIDCADFLDQSGDLLDDWTTEQAGHDFWLTRNGHGAGFWDRGKDTGDDLTTIAHNFGSLDLYLGDDGMIYGQ